MPQTFYVSSLNLERCIVTKNSASHSAHVLDRRPGEVYVHYTGTDKRLDEWVPEDIVSTGGEHDEGGAERKTNGTKKRKRSKSTEDPAASTSSAVPADGPNDAKSVRMMSEEEYDIEHHKQITARRNFDRVIFGRWSIKTWYFSPYPLLETELDADVATPPLAGASVSAVRGAGGGPPPTIGPRLPRVSVRSHGRTSDLLAGGLGRHYAQKDNDGKELVLWVCDKCFKYMSDGAVWEGHCRKCTLKHPPGRKVYQRGAHIIWEVDGAKDKLYCQNLSLFGKLFIDVKTLFFDCDNFLFYILTDADSQRDHVLGFFSKEKVSYDDYNLACIVTLPPYQRKGYGMLLIEFSYELSRRAGKLGTPERPLSDLGLRSYLTYWTATIVRYLRRLLSVLPADVKYTTSPAPSAGPHTSVTPELEMLLSPSPMDDTTNGRHGSRKRKKSTKGWDGEAITPSEEKEREREANDPLFQQRIHQTIANADGSATTHVAVRCTLEDIAQATWLRIEDVAFALNECGLLQRRKRAGLRTSASQDTNGSSKSNGAAGAAVEEPEEYIVISRKMIEDVAQERNVKRMCMDINHVLL